MQQRPLKISDEGTIKSNVDDNYNMIGKKGEFLHMHNSYEIFE